MKKTLLLVAILATSLTSALAQEAHCGFDEHLEKMLSEDPSAMQVIFEHNKKTEELKRNLLNGESVRAGGPRIIPTVFHVIQNGGVENISYEQIEDQMRILNEDYRRLNEDTVNTRPEFLPVAADANIEFRLAKLDPMGNCTDGVVRIMSPLTDNASDESGVKGLSYWNSSNYFNVWVVNTIDNNGEQGTVLGYAQFPGIGSAENDGVVVRADYIGSIGTGAGNSGKGRTLTHEAGHWLFLFHPFQGGCSGFFDDDCEDTPPVAEASFGCNQNANTCTNDNPDLPDQVENYMDYANGSCQNMFTLDQKARMDATLSGSRSNIWSSSNLAATGVLMGETPCAPYAQFYSEKQVVCAGEPITYTDNSYNGTVNTYSWTMPGATPNSSSDQNPTVVYDAPGVYSVTQSVSNAQGSDSYTLTDVITVIPSTAEINGSFSYEGFEDVDDDYIVLSDGQGNTWVETDAAYAGSKSIYLNNYSGNPLGSVDEFQLPSVDLTQMNDPDLYFRVSYKQRNNDASDRLRVYISENCGENWSLRYTKQGSSLASVGGTQSSSFVPSAQSDWELIEINLSNYVDAEHFLVKFQGTSDVGNNIYIDDIQITGSLNVQDEQTEFDFSIAPNPMSTLSVINLKTSANNNYSIDITDVTGKLVSNIFSGELNVGNHRFGIGPDQIESAGVYLISISSSAGRSMKKLVVQ